MVKGSVALLCKSTSRVNRRKANETAEKHLRQVTHLYLNGKNLDELGKEISLCKNLNVLYLYDNQLTRIPLFYDATLLTHLYLQNNNIKRIERLKDLKKLEKLFLSRNSIVVVEGLEGLHCLQELHIDSQMLPPGENMLFDERTMISIGDSLLRLNVSNNRLESIEGLVPLKNITYLSAANNMIKRLEELTDILRNWPSLTELELAGNPVIEKPRSRDAIVVSTASLQVLDGRIIHNPTRQFLENWSQFRASQHTDSMVVDGDAAHKPMLQQSLTRSSQPDLSRLSKQTALDSRTDERVESDLPVSITPAMEAHYITPVNKPNVSRARSSHEGSKMSFSASLGWLRHTPQDSGVRGPRGESTLYR